MKRQVQMEGGANFRCEASPYTALEVHFEGMMINVEPALIKVGSRLRMFADGAFCLIDEPDVVCFVEVDTQPVPYYHGDRTPIMEFAFQFIRINGDERHRDSYKGPQYTSFIEYDDSNGGSYICEDMIQYIENDRFHCLTGPANSMFDKITNESDHGYYKNGYSVTDEVIESGYEDGSAELEMFLSLITVPGDLL